MPPERSPRACTAAASPTNACNPFPEPIPPPRPFSPRRGGRFAFFVGASLRRVSLTGDSARRIAEDSKIRGLGDSFGRAGSWGADGTIVYSSYTGLWEVPATGGQPRRLPLGTDDRTSGTTLFVRAPHVISGGARVLYHAPRTRDPRSAVLRLLDRATGKVSTVLEQASHGTLVGDTLLLFMRGTALMAVRFDAAAGTASGEPITVDPDIANASSMQNTVHDSNVGQYAVSAQGDVVVARGGFYPQRRLVLVRRAPSGALRQLALPRGTVPVRAEFAHG